jgi:hypothetical protein
VQVPVQLWYNYLGMWVNIYSIVAIPAVTLWRGRCVCVLSRAEACSMEIDVHEEKYSGDRGELDHNVCLVG